jgi:hypothetical protein
MSIQLGNESDASIHPRLTLQGGFAVNRVNAPFHVAWHFEPTFARRCLRVCWGGLRHVRTSGQHFRRYDSFGIPMKEEREK